MTQVDSGTTTDVVWDSGPTEPDPVRRPSRRYVELVVLVVLAVAYNWVRGLDGDDRAAALRHAHDVVSLEGPLFYHLELPLNHWLVTVAPLAVAACYYYAVLHYVLTPTVLLLSRARGGWQYVRGYVALVTASAIGLVCYALYPAAPPRLVPGLHMIDVLQRFSAYGWWGGAASAPRGIGDATNQFAAVPSLHFGWSLWCGIQLWNLGGRRWRVVAVAYPTIQVLVVLSTANHFLFDVLSGGACVLVGYAVAAVLGQLRHQPWVSSARAAKRLRPRSRPLSEDTPVLAAVAPRQEAGRPPHRARCRGVQRRPPGSGRCHRQAGVVAAGDTPGAGD